MKTRKVRGGTRRGRDDQFRMDVREGLWPMWCRMPNPVKLKPAGVLADTFERRQAA